MEKKEKNIIDLENNSHIIKQMISIGSGKGRAGRFMIKVREGRVTDKEIADWLKKDFKKVLKAENESR